MLRTRHFFAKSTNTTITTTITKMLLKSPSTAVSHLSARRVSIEFQANDNPLDLDNLLVPVFELNGWKVLMKDLAHLYNYPSTYHIMSKLIKNSTITKSDFGKSDPQLNQQLFDHQLIDKLDLCYYYIDIVLLATVIDHQSLYATPPDSQPQQQQQTSHQFDKITLSHVFPQYGFIDSTVELNHATFNCLTTATKYNYYKTINNFKHAPMTKLFEQELELFFSLNDYSKVDLNNTTDPSKQRKPTGKIRKSSNNTDPNNLDLSESVIPGQGLIQEFNVSHVCKVPNYYVTNQHQQQLVSNNTPQINVPKREGKVNRHVQQLVFNNDYDYFNFSKYFYTKTYRGPGSGNYKDAALVNRVNKIPLAKSNLTKLHAKLDYTSKNRHQLHLKGLLPESFDPRYTNYVIKSQRLNVEDHNNLEILHSVVQFNFLVNSYRQISYHTWKNYYKFKMVDYDQLLNQLETGPNPQNFLLSRFNLPHEYHEINRHLDIDFRTKIKRPLYYQLKMPGQTPQYLTNIEIIKLPNANEIGWDNLKKYHRD